jgi:UDP-glucose 4-epimerase
MNRYLVIGGNGIIGHYLTRQLVEQGQRPLVMSRSADPSLVKDVLDRCELIAGDVTDAAMMDHVIAQHGITHIAHLGALLPIQADADPALGMRINVEGTANILTAAVKHKVKRVIIASSKGAYGSPRGRHGHPEYLPMTEDTRPYPHTVYGISKVASDELTAWYRRTHGIEAASVRFSSTVGPGKISRHGGHYSRYGGMIENSLAGKPVRIDAGGDARSDTIYNGDIARGMIAALHAPTLRHDLYNISTGSGISLREFADAVRRVIPGADIEVGGGTEIRGSQSVILDATRAREDFGFTADPSPEHIVRGYVDTMKLLGLKPAV